MRKFISIPQIIFAIFFAGYALLAWYVYNKKHTVEDNSVAKIRLEISRNGEVEYVTAPLDCVVHVIADADNKLIDIQAIPDIPQTSQAYGQQTNTRITQTAGKANP